MPYFAENTQSWNLANGEAAIAYNVLRDAYTESGLEPNDAAAKWPDFFQFILQEMADNPPSLNEQTTIHVLLTREAFDPWLVPLDYPDYYVPQLLPAASMEVMNDWDDDPEVSPPALNTEVNDLNSVVAAHYAKKKAKPVERKATDVVSKVWPLSRQAPDWWRKNKLNLKSPEGSFPYHHPVGIEIELEHFHLPLLEGNAFLGLNPQGNPIWNPGAEELNSAWSVKNDGSLRNNGREIVSNYGMHSDDVPYYLDLLDKHLKEEKGFNIFTHRCGLHIHLDVSHFTLEEIYKVLLVYSVLERVMFRISGNRDKGPSSKFCVPIDESVNSIDAAISAAHAGEWSDFVTLISKGQKYMACNIRTITGFNTLEFRHHEGTADTEVITGWMLLLLDLLLARKDTPTKELEQEVLDLGRRLNSASFVQKCLPNSWMRIAQVPGWEKLIRNGALMVKSAFLSEPQLVPFMEN